MSCFWNIRQTAETDDARLPLVVKLPETRVWRVDLTDQRLEYSTDYRYDGVMTMSPGDNIETLSRVQRIVCMSDKGGSCLCSLSIEDTSLVASNPLHKLDAYVFVDDSKAELWGVSGYHGEY